MVAFLIYDHQDISYLLLVGLHSLDHPSYFALEIFEALPTSYARFWKLGTKPTLHPQEQPQRLILKPHQRTLQLQAIQDEYQAWILQNASQACSSNIISQFADHPECLVYELLQNSVDSGATSVRYDLVPKMSHTRLIVTHDGRPFNLADVHGLTNFANSTKVPNSNVIGYMGLGFKSIFAVAEMVTITSGFLSFRYSRRRNGRFIWIEFSLLDTCISPPDPRTVVEIDLETSATEAVWNRIRDMTSSKALLILASLDKPLRSISVGHGDFKAHLQVKDPIWIRSSKFDYQVTHWNGIDYLLVRQGSSPSDYVCLCVTLSRTEDERQIGRIYTFLPLVDEKNPHIIDIHAPFKVNSRRDAIERNRQDRSNSDLWERIASANAQMMIVLYTIYHREHQELLKRLFWRLIPPTTSQIRRHFEALFATLPLSWTLPENQLQLSTSQAIWKPRDPPIVETSYLDLSQLSQEELSHVLPLFPRSSSSSDFATFWGRPGKLTDPLALFKSPISDLKMVRNRGVEMVSKAFAFDYHWTLEAMARIDDLCGSRLSPKDEVSKESHASLSALLHLVLSHSHQLKHIEYLKKSNSSHYYSLSLEEPCSFIKSLQNRRWISIRVPSSDPSRFVLYEPRSVIMGTLLEDEMIYYPSRLKRNTSYLELHNNGLGIIDAQSLQGIIYRLVELKRFWFSQAQLYSKSLVNSAFFLQCATELYHVIPKQDLESQFIRDAFAQHGLIYNHKSDCWLKPQQAFLDNRDDPEGLQESYPEDRVLFSALGVPDTPSLSRLSATLHPLRSRNSYDLDQDRRLQNIYTTISKKLDSAATTKEANLDSSELSLITKILERPILVSVSKSIMDMTKPIFMFDNCMALESLVTRSSRDELEESFVHPSLLSSMSLSTRTWLSNLCSNVRTVSYPVLTSAPPADVTHPEGQRIIRSLNDALNALNGLLAEAYKSRSSPCLSKFDFQFQYCHTRSIETQWCDQPTKLTGACHDRTFFVCIKNRPFVWTGLFTWMFSTQGPFPRFSTDFPSSSVSDLVTLVAKYFRSVLAEGASEQDRNSALEKCRGYFLHKISISPQMDPYSKPSPNPLVLTSFPSNSSLISTSGLVQQTPQKELPSTAAASSSSSFNSSQSSPISSVIPILGSHMGKRPTVTPIPSPKRTSMFAPTGTTTASYSSETPKSDSNSPFTPSALTRTLTPPIPWTPSPRTSPAVKPFSSASSIPHPSIPRPHLKSVGSSRSSSSNFSGTPMTSEQMRINNERGLLAEEAALRYEHFRLRTHPAFQELPFIKNALPSDMDAYQLLERHVCLTRKSEATPKNPDLQFSDAAAWDIHTFSYLDHKWVPSKLEVKCTKNSGGSFYLSKREHKNAWEATQGGPPYVIYFYKEFKEEVVKGMLEQVLPPTAALCIQSQKDWEDNLEVKEEVSYRVTFKNISKLLVEESSAPFDG